MPQTGLHRSEIGGHGSRPCPSGAQGHPAHQGPTFLRQQPFRRGAPFYAQGQRSFPSWGQWRRNSLSPQGPPLRQEHLRGVRETSAGAHPRDTPSRAAATPRTPSPRATRPCRASQSQSRTPPISLPPPRPTTCRPAGHPLPINGRTRERHRQRTAALGRVGNWKVYSLD